MRYSGVVAKLNPEIAITQSSVICDKTADGMNNLVEHLIIQCDTVICRIYNFVYLLANFTVKCYELRGRANGEIKFGLSLSLLLGEDASAPTLEKWLLSLLINFMAISILADILRGK